MSLVIPAVMHWRSAGRRVLDCKVAIATGARLELFPEQRP